MGDQEDGAGMIRLQMDEAKLQEAIANAIVNGAFARQIGNAVQERMGDYRVKDVVQQAINSVVDNVIKEYATEQINLPENKAKIKKMFDDNFERFYAKFEGVCMDKFVQGLNQAFRSGY